LGVVGARSEIIELADPGRADVMYHGGSFNGNALGAIAGRITVEDLTAAKIAKMDEFAGQLKSALERRAYKLGLPLALFNEGSVMGVYFTRGQLRPGTDIPNENLSLSFHLASLNNGVHMGPYGLVSLSTAIDDAAMNEVIPAMEDALDRVAADFEPSSNETPQYAHSSGPRNSS
jgi:glutamate-1-semialdehyde 2,1-aminomutase